LLKVKVVPLHAMKTPGGEAYRSYSFFTSALDGGEWSASSPGRVLAQGKDPSTHCTGHLGGVVSVLATEPKVRGFEPGKDDGYLRAIKISSTPSFGREVKPECPCRKVLRRGKYLLKTNGDEYTKFTFPSPILLIATEMSLLTEPPDYWWLPERSGRRVRS
jgi:hypothetical protein